MLISFFEQRDDICMAFLFGSRARGEAEVGDWDIAVSFYESSESNLNQLARLERLRSKLSKALGSTAESVDLIDLKRAPLNLCITVANEGKILKGHRTLELFRFYQRAWSAQEEFHFRATHGL